MGGPWGSLGVLGGVLWGPWGGPGVISGSLWGPWGSQRGSQGASEGSFWSYWGNAKSLKNHRFLFVFRNMGSQGRASERALGPSGGRGEVPWGPRGHQREPRESQESPQRGSGGVAGPPRAPRGGTWAPHGHGRVSPEVLAIAQPPRTWPLSSYRHDLSDLVLRILELNVYTP